MRRPAPRLDRAQPPRGAPLSSGELRRLGLIARLPMTWTASGRRRRLLLIGLAAPGFATVATTPMHRQPALLLAGLLLFGAAMLFRRLTEPVFLHAEAAHLWPPRPNPLDRSASRKHTHV